MMNSEYCRLNIKKYTTPIMSASTPLLSSCFFGNSASRKPLLREGEVPACSLQAWLLLGRRSQGHLDCSLAPAHLLLLMQLQGHQLTSKMTQIKKTQVLFPRKNIAKGTTDPGVDCFDQLFWFWRFGSVCLIG